MTESFTKLSGSTNGKGIVVSGTSSAADVTIHTADATSLDIVTLWAVNEDADGETRSLSISWGDETNSVFTVPVPAKVGPVLVADKLPITSSLVIGAWADEANDVQVYGLVVRSA